MKTKEMLARLKKGEDPLELSIEKWEDIAKGKDMNIFGTSNCALCKMYQLDEVSCQKCPIYKATGKVGCDATPYEDYEEAYDLDRSKATLKKLAEKEVAFLKSLRKTKK